MYKIILKMQKDTFEKKKTRGTLFVKENGVYFFYVMTPLCIEAYNMNDCDKVFIAYQPY